MDANGSTRREWLLLCAAAGASGVFVSRSDAAERLVPAVSVVDHLLLGVADLDTGVSWFEKAAGVKAVFGGTHPGMGTRNALASLGGKRYLEIIAPDPAQTAFNFRIDVRKLAEPRLVNWAASTTDIEAVAKRARATGYKLFGPQPGSRERPDGKTLRWKLLGVMHDLADDGIDPIPFFIEWAADAVHPSQESPKGCELKAFEIEHPNSAAVKKTLTTLGIAADVRKGAVARLTARLSSPKGKVTLR
ncbi:MAG: VOC family protein [Acidobacteriota bacterium]|nr:VOC family protein [Acidobacteriota bacterium]MDQ5870945.1 VOC family protein [Acidobacteriota bacterium]